MFRKMNDNELSFHAGATENALISANEDLPVRIVVDNGRVEVYWTDDELDTFNYYNLSSFDLQIGEMIGHGVQAWMWKGISPVEIQSMLTEILPTLGFHEI